MWVKVADAVPGRTEMGSEVDGIVRDLVCVSVAMIAGLSGRFARQGDAR